MKFTPTAIPDVFVLDPQVFQDERGFFMETYRETDFADQGISVRFVQDNHSGSTQGILRGLHYQLNNAQGKLVRVVAGEIYDVAVDLRRSSATFGEWVGVNLSAENKSQIWIPAGFAHGFYVISQWAEVVYKATDFYAPQWDRTLLWNDPQIGITWPIPAGQQPILSTKDQAGKTLADAEVYEDR